MRPWSFKIGCAGLNRSSMRVFSPTQQVAVNVLLDPNAPIDVGTIEDRSISVFTLAMYGRLDSALRCAFDKKNREIYVERPPRQREGMWLLEMADRFDGVHWTATRIKRAARLVAGTRAAAALHAMAEVERERSEFYRDEFLASHHV